MKRRQQGILTGMPFMANVVPRTFVDDLGRKLYLAKVPNRLVSLAPSITETLYAIGLGDRVVGVTDFCDYPPDARSKPKVGYARPNLETIVALQPDLVLAPQDFIRPDVLGKLEQLKIPTFIVEAKTVEDIASRIQTIGRMLGQPESGDRVAMELRGRVNALKARTQALSRPRVLYVLNSQPLITVGPGSFIDQLIEMAGGANVAARALSPYPRLSMEAVLAHDPEVIIFVEDHQRHLERLKAWCEKRGITFHGIRLTACDQYTHALDMEHAEKYLRELLHSLRQPSH